MVKKEDRAVRQSEGEDAPAIKSLKADLREFQLNELPELTEEELTALVARREALSKILEQETGCQKHCVDEVNEIIRDVLHERNERQDDKDR